MPTTGGRDFVRQGMNYAKQGGRYRRRLKNYQLSTAKQLRNLKRKVRNITPELKFVDTVVTASFTTAGAIAPLSMIAKGDEANERDGDKVKIQSIDVYITNIGGSASDNTRVILFWDTSSNGVVPAITEVLESAAYDSHTNNENNSRFSIVKQYLFANDQNGNKNHFIRFYLKLKNAKHTSYQGTTAVQANLLQNNLYLLVIGDSGTNQSGYQVRCRLRFID